MKRVWAVPLLAMLCQGCAHHVVSLQSTWYVVSEHNQSTTYVSVLNQGNTTIGVETLILNPIRDRIAWFEDPQRDGWELRVDQQLEPGQILFRPAGQFRRKTNDGYEDWSGCRVPVEIDARLAGRKALVISELKASMPNAIPAAWDNMCIKNAATSITTGKQMQFEATLEWSRNGQDFLGQRYSRAHTWHFDGGATVPASSSPLSVPLPMSDAAAVDPEEALVAAASSCHMLFFLSIAAKRGHTVDSYRDHALGLLGKNTQGKMAMTRITLRPEIAFAGTAPPGAEELAAIHHEAHEQCYIANTLNCPVVVDAP